LQKSRNFQTKNHGLAIFKPKITVNTTILPATSRITNSGRLIIEMGTVSNRFEYNNALFFIITY